MTDTLCRSDPCRTLRHDAMGRAAERKGSGPAEKDGYSARTDLFNFSPNPPCFAAANASARYAFSVLLCAAVVFHSPASDAIQGWYSRAREVQALPHPEDFACEPHDAPNRESLELLSRKWWLVRLGFNGGTPHRRRRS